MSKTVKLKKGLDIRLVGAASKVKTNAKTPQMVSMKPSDFHGMTPKMLVKEGQEVKAGTIIFQDKYNEPIKFSSPVSGKVEKIVRGEKRRILEVLISTSQDQQFEPSDVKSVESMSNDEVKATMLASGLWPFVKQRPLDIVANPINEPKAIFVSTFDSSPLAPDFNYVLEEEGEAFNAGMDALKKLTSGKVHLTLNGKSSAATTFTNVKGVEVNTFTGKHPAGNVGTHIHHIDPVNKGEFVWTVNAQDVAIIGRYFLTGKYNAKRTIALTGSEIKDPQYIDTIIGANVADLLDGQLTSDNVRVISGNVLTGDKIAQDGYLGFYHNQITVIPEGNELKFVLTKGWLGLGFDKFSNSRLFPTFLTGNKKFRLDTNTNGEERAFVVTGELEKVFPFDILPMQLAKAAITDDIDGMENLGIYEVAPEDFALCEYVCTTKINIQDKIRKGLDLIGEECM
ncbi:MAG: Na(+)-translocating NADH-quinone reductase subunit A [Crocinitomicaceae bacterium]|nr:Na(+)-translocating NADH-quinone reductase subunit A [Crocinitomicaceae bacterium]MDG1777638.1 Na(+)-translocating NADH-quinone reductase subunit A [Crocinitomicaceae bacterium]